MVVGTVVVGWAEAAMVEATEAVAKVEVKVVVEPVAEMVVAVKEAGTAEAGYWVARVEQMAAGTVVVVKVAEVMAAAAKGGEARGMEMEEMLAVVEPMEVVGHTHLGEQEAAAEVVAMVAAALVAEMAQAWTVVAAEEARVALWEEGAAAVLAV
jgi:hypothetical protein